MANRTPNFDSIAYNKIQALLKHYAKRCLERLKPITCSTNIFNLSFNNSKAERKWTVLSYYLYREARRAADWLINRGRERQCIRGYNNYPPFVYV